MTPIWPKRSKERLPDSLITHGKKPSDFCRTVNDLADLTSATSHHEIQNWTAGNLVGWEEVWLTGWLVGWFAGSLLSSGDRYSGHALLCLSRGGQRADQGCEAAARLGVFTELKHSAEPDELTLLQTRCLSVPVFACLLCHEMERACMIVPVEQLQVPALRGRPIPLSWGVLLGDKKNLKKQCCMLHSGKHFNFF